MAQVIKQNETPGIKNCNEVKGASGELGCYQLMPKTYRGYSMDVLGYVAPRSEINDKYIVASKAEEWINKGQTAQRILLSWNGGEGAKKCSSGVNKFKVKYDSCAYVTKGLAILNK